MTLRIALALERTPTKTFAGAIDWPGLARSGKTESMAIEALLAYLDRYALVARAAGEPFPTDDVLVEVVDDEDGWSSSSRAWIRPVAGCTPARG